MNNLETALRNYISSPKNPLYNFELGYQYELLGHTAAAASFYIRTGEFSSDHANLQNLTYEALVRLAICFESQGSRLFTTKGVLLRAIALCPDRPEAYLNLSRIYEISKEWQECYATSILGEKIDSQNSTLSTITDLNYTGKIGFMFHRAVAGWNIGLWDESLDLFRKLSKYSILPYNIKSAVNNNLINLKDSNWKSPITYDKSLHEHLKVKFKDSNTIFKNYSQVYQDMFVLTMLNGKQHGTFLEIGSADPFYGSNTALLEKAFNWKGISIDYNKELCDKFSEHRLSTIINEDATKIDYDKLLSQNYTKLHNLEKIYIDYLQIDLDPPFISYEVLLKIPFDKYEFGVITFEHDSYNDTSNAMQKSRDYLKSYGYELIVNNISPDNYSSFEDWWVHPRYINESVINEMKNISDEPKRGDRYMLNRI